MASIALPTPVRNAALVAAVSGIAAAAIILLLVGSWIVGDEPAGLCLREGASRITTDRARFVPHLIDG